MSISNHSSRSVSSLLTFTPFFFSSSPSLNWHFLLLHPLFALLPFIFVIPQRDPSPQRVIHTHSKCIDFFFLEGDMSLFTLFNSSHSFSLLILSFILSSSLIPAGPPTFPYNCQVMNQSDTSLVILCTFDVELSSNTSWSSAHLFPRKWSDQTRLLIHPRTHYICEVYHLTASHLVANVSTTISLSMPRHEGEILSSTLRTFYH